MFRVKICGITTPADAEVACSAGADAIGLNFYAPSPRYVTPAQATAIAAAVPSGVERVGVFVRLPSAQVLQIAMEANLTGIQLHGDESPEQAAQVLQATQLPVYLAIRCQESSLAGVAAYLRRLAELSRLPAGILLDAYQPGSFGGTGHKLDWDAVRAQRHQLGNLPLILAGGLRPENVAQAVACVRPDAVDVASGVEALPGKKDPDLVREFLLRAKNAFAASS